MKSKLLLKNWNLPECVLESYEKKGLTAMFQWQADCLSIDGVLDGRNLLYAAPTSAGKTLVTEILLLKRVLETGKKALFILPFVSVAREKLFHMRELFQEAGICVDGYMGGHAPTNGFSSVDIAVCTIEKANGLLNRLIEEKNVGQIGMLVIDELHMVGDEGRGYILELLLTKIRFMAKSSSPQSSHSDREDAIQIVGMSAALPNLDLLADWLDAAVYTTDFRPVPLERCMKVGSSIFDEKLMKLREFSPAFSCKNDEDNLAALCYETLHEGHSVLIFCPTKNWCEKLSDTIARQFYDVNSAHDKNNSVPSIKLNMEGLKDVFEQLKRSPVGVDTVLNRTLPLGVAYHHAGLTTEERDMLEAGFRIGAIRVLVATSTLSSGVNLPARRVIIRTPMFNRKTLDVRTYLQMTGRAGRKGVDDRGESILICRPTEQSKGKALLTAKPLPVKSCLVQADKEELTTSMKRAILEIIVSGIASTYESVMEYTNCTLLSAQMRAQEPQQKIKGPMTRRRSSSLSPHRSKKSGFSMEVIESCIKWLVEHEFVRLQQTDNDSNEVNEGNEMTRNIAATQLGRAALLSSLPTSDALTVLGDLHQAMKALALDTELHLIYLVTPIFCYNDWTGLDWYQYLNVYESLSNSHKNAATLIGVTEQFLMRMASGAPVSKRGKQAEKIERQLGTHRRFYAALALHDLVQEVPLTQVCSKYSCNRGMLQQLQQSAASFAGMVTTFCQELGWWSLEVLLREFQTRLAFGVQRELMDLVQISLLNSQRARALYAAGLTSCQQISQATPANIELVLRNSAHFQMGRKGVNEADWEVEERRKLRSVHITGQRGLTEYEAAVMIIQEASKLVGLQQQCNVVNGSFTSIEKVFKTYEKKPKDGKTFSPKTASPENKQHEMVVPSNQNSSKHDQTVINSSSEQELSEGSKTYENNGKACREVSNGGGALSSGVSLDQSCPESSLASLSSEIMDEGSQKRCKKVTQLNLGFNSQVSEKSSAKETVKSQKNSDHGSLLSSLTDSQLKQVLDDNTMDLSSVDDEVRSSASYLKCISRETAETSIRVCVDGDHTSKEEKLLLRAEKENPNPTIRDSMDLLLQDVSDFSSCSGQRVDSSDVSGRVDKEEEHPTSKNRIVLRPGVNSIFRRGTMSDSIQNSDLFEIQDSDVENKDECACSNQNSMDDSLASQGPITLFCSQESENSSVLSPGSPSPITLVLDGESSDNTVEDENMDVPEFCGEQEVRESEKLSDNRGNSKRQSSLTDSQLCAMLDGSFTQEEGLGSNVIVQRTMPDTVHPSTKKSDIAANSMYQNVQFLSPNTIEAMNASFSPCTADPNSFDRIKINVPKSMEKSVLVSTPKYSEKGFSTKIRGKVLEKNYEVSPLDNQEPNFSWRKVEKTLTKQSDKASQDISMANGKAKDLKSSNLDPVMDSPRENLSDNSVEDMFHVTSVPTLTKLPANSSTSQSPNTALSFGKLSDCQSIEIFSITPTLRATSHSLQERKRKSPDSVSPLGGKTVKTSDEIDDSKTPEKVSSPSKNLILSSQKDEPVRKRTNKGKNLKARKPLNANNEKNTKSRLHFPSNFEKRLHCKQPLVPEKFRSGTIQDPCLLSDVTNLTHRPDDGAVVSSQIRIPSPDKSLEVAASQLGLTIVDVCSHVELFTTFMEEWSTKTHFSIAITIRAAKEKVKGKIGIPASKSSSIGTDFDATNDRIDVHHVSGIAVCWGQQDAYYISLENEEDDLALYDANPEFSSLQPPPVSSKLNTEKLLKILRKPSCPLQKKNSALICFDIKKQFKILRKVLEVASTFWQDPSVAAWMLNPSEDQNTLVGLINHFIPEDIHVLRGLKMCHNFGSISCCRRIDLNAPARIRSCAEAVCSYRLMKKLKLKLKEVGLWSFFTNVEMPHLKSLAILEINGIGFDGEACSKEIGKLHEMSRQLEKIAYKFAKKQFNLGSPLEVAKVLYRDLGLPPKGSSSESVTDLSAVKPGVWRKGSRRTRIPSSWSTKKEVLEKLKDLHPLPEVILHWRRINFTLTNSVHPFDRVSVYCEERKMNRIHPECLTHSVTGRVSAAEPNIQNVAKSFTVKFRGIDEDCERMHEVCIRNLFIPTKGSIFLAADYSQLEIRIFSHLSGDDKLLQILNSDTGDVFKMIAAQWKSIDIQNVTAEERQRAKQICYGMLYGIGAKALSQQLNVDEKSAESFMESFLRSFPGIRSHIRNLVQECSKKGYVETLLGRRRYLPSIADSNMSVRSQAERRAVNTTVQGSAADVIKMATVEIHKKMKKKWKIVANPMLSKHSEKRPLATRRRRTVSTNDCLLVMHLHDELIFEVRSDIFEEASLLVRSCMENAVRLKVKLPVKISAGPTWGKLKEVELSRTGKGNSV